MSTPSEDKFVEAFSRLAEQLCMQLRDKTPNWELAATVTLIGAAISSLVEALPSNALPYNPTKPFEDGRQKMYAAIADNLTFKLRNFSILTASSEFKQ